MTGGWRRGRGEAEREVLIPPRYETKERVLNDALSKWSQIWRLRRHANRDLKTLGTSFPQWRVLYLAEQLVRETPEGVSEQAVAERADMDVSTVSRVLQRLEKKGLVDRGMEECDFTYRVLVTDAGHRLLTDTQSRLSRFATQLSAIGGADDDDSDSKDPEYDEC